MEKALYHHEVPNNDLISDFLDNIIRSLNTVDTRMFIFILICCNYLSFSPTGNEEVYFALAKQFFDPAWIPSSFTLSQGAQTRLIFTFILGFVLNFLSFSQAAFFGRLLSFLLLAIPLARIFKLLRITNIEILFLMQVFYFSHQAFFGGEWIFGGFESKTLSYFFVFYALYFLLVQRFMTSTIFTMLATYFHILVGGWFFLLTILYLLLSKARIRTIIASTLTYTILLSPFIVYLGNHFMLNTQSEINGIDVNWVNAYFRNPHHLAPFKSIKFFATQFFPGVAISASCFFLCAHYFTRIKDIHIRKLNLLNIIIFSLLFISLFIAYFDKTGNCLKFYLFRLSALSMFLVLIEFVVIFKGFLINEKSAIKATTIIFVLVLPFFLNACLNTTYLLLKRPSNAHLDEMAEFVKTNTDPNDAFMFVGFGKWDEVSFLRKARRDRFVVYKFFPAEATKIYDWYVRVQDKTEVEKNIDHVFELKKKYRIDYVVSNRLYEKDRLRKVFCNSKYYIYKIE